MGGNGSYKYVKPADILLDDDGSSVVLNTHECRFMTEAAQWKDYTEPFANYVPFMSYWPTYASMTQEQRKWYFYWRGEVRKKNYIPTDLSYVCIHLYELLGGIGWDVPEDGFKILTALWKIYGEQHPQLETLMPEWLFDFYNINNLHGLFEDEIDIILLKSDSKELLNILIERISAHKRINLPAELLLQLIDYKLEDSKFLAVKDRESILRMLYGMITKVDIFMQNKYQKGIFEFYTPGGTLSSERIAYINAIKERRITYTIYYKPYLEHLPLRRFMTQVVRYTENAIRRFSGYRGRLNDAELEPEIKKAIDAVFDKNICTEGKDYNSVQISINVSYLERQRREADELRDMLSVEDETGREGPQHEDPSYKAENKHLEDNTVSQPSGITQEGYAYEENTGLTEFVSLLTTGQKEALEILLKGEDVAAALERSARKAQTLPELMIDDINDVFYTLYNDLLLDTAHFPPEISDEYYHQLKKLIT